MKKIVFETENCSRCDGTGQHSYNPMHGRVCFKCKGRKTVLTQRGQAAQAEFTTEVAAQSQRQAWAVRKDDRIWGSKVVERDGWGTVREGWVTVLDVQEEDTDAGKIILIQTDGEDYTSQLTREFLVFQPSVRRDVMEYVAERFEGASLVDVEEG